jgi:hypothetical protein
MEVPTLAEGFDSLCRVRPLDESGFAVGSFTEEGT